MRNPRRWNSPARLCIIELPTSFSLSLSISPPLLFAFFFSQNSLASSLLAEVRRGTSSRNAEYIVPFFELRFDPVRPGNLADSAKRRRLPLLIIHRGRRFEFCSGNSMVIGLLLRLHGCWLDVSSLCCEMRTSVRREVAYSLSWLSGLWNTILLISL